MERPSSRAAGGSGVALLPSLRCAGSAVAGAFVTSYLD